MEELERVDWVADLGFDPFRTPEQLGSDREFWRQLIAKIGALRQCVAELEGREIPSLQEPLPPMPDNYDPVRELGFDPWKDPSQLANDPQFWRQLTRRAQELEYRCGRPRSARAVGNYLQCIMGCAWRTNLCVTDCASVGPPAPYCLERCDDQKAICEFICWLGALN